MIWLQISEAGKLIETAVKANDTLPWLFSVLIIAFCSMVLFGTFFIIKALLSNKPSSHSHKGDDTSKKIEDLEDRINDILNKK